MSAIDDSQLGRLLVERRLCTSNELELVRAELKGRKDLNNSTGLGKLLIEQGYVTHSQLHRLTRDTDEDSMYRPAQQIPGFQILSKLGQGAMAVVFKAKQLSLDRTVAIKVLPKRLSENPEFVERFYREGRAAARLNHPHIVQAYDVGEAGSYHYFVMEYIDGQTVYDLLTESRAIKEPEAIRLVLEAARSLEHAHAQGLIHRDVKPKNLMISKKGILKLADMGLAREIKDFATANAEAGRAYGTPYYISPEQIRGEISIDARADVYGLGATFYHMVTGQVPFDGSTPSSVMHKHLKDTLVPPDHLNQSLTSGIGEIIEVMMAKSPDDRYPSMTELIADLEAVAKGEAPLQARHKYDHELLKTLASGSKVTDPQADDGTIPGRSPRISVQWLLLLGVLLAVSVLINLVLLARS